MSLSPLVSPEPAVLPHGAPVDLRATGPDDLELLTRLHEELSDHSRLRRFLCLGVDLPDAVGRLLAPEVAGLVALAGPRAIGHACLVPGRTCDRGARVRRRRRLAAPWRREPRCSSAWSPRARHAA